MLQRDADGFIISKLPKSAKPYKNLSYMIVPEAGGLPEYTPDAYNRVNAFFRNLLQSPFEIDNLNHREWNETATGLERTGLANICEAAYEKTAAPFVEELANTLRETLKASAPEEYKNNLAHETVLDIRIAAASGKVHIEFSLARPKISVSPVFLFERLWKISFSANGLTSARERLPNLHCQNCAEKKTLR